MFREICGSMSQDITVRNPVYTIERQQELPMQRSKRSGRQHKKPLVSVKPEEPLWKNRFGFKIQKPAVPLLRKPAVPLLKQPEESGLKKSLKLSEEMRKQSDELKRRQRAKEYWKK